MNIEKFSIPFTKDPFVNTPLINAGFDPETGEERFWISTWNSNIGCLGVLVTPSGKNRVYRFEKQKDLICCGAYSAYLTDNDTLWLISDLQAFVKLTLSTGELEIYETGAKSGLVFAGMQYDEKTGKLLAGALVPPEMYAVSFDTREKKTVKIHSNFTEGTTMRAGFPIGDGTYCVGLWFVKQGMYRWNPQDETLTRLFDTENCTYDCVAACPMDKDGRHYIHGKGWMEKDGSLTPEPQASVDADWFAYRNGKVYGVLETVIEHKLCSWDVESGEIEYLHTFYDNVKCNLTKEGNIIAVSVYGELTVVTDKGEVILQQWMDTSAQGEVDCVIPVNDRFILGTPFITQRFWIIDKTTGKGFDAGRASPGGGEVLQVWNACGKTFMASYTEGVLTEFDPDKEINFPENPRIVYQPKYAMRPVANAQVGDTLWYASNHHYGIVGCELVRYNALTGEGKAIDDPFPSQQIVSLYTLPGEKTIVGGTSYQPDCAAAPAISDESFVIEICPETMEIISKAKAPAGTMNVFVVGNIDDENLLCMFEKADWEQSMGIYNIRTKEVTRLGESIGFKNKLHRTGKQGEFVMFSAGKIKQLSFANGNIVSEKLLAEDKNIYKIHVFGSDIYGTSPRELTVFYDAVQ